LPNGIISKTTLDTSTTQLSAVSVSMHSDSGTLALDAEEGSEPAPGGTEGNAGAGVGTSSLYGPEFTVSFKTNPGLLKSLEVDTSLINNPGSPDYWVTNIHQGQFSSRYSVNIGRVNTLMHGSKLLYSNRDWGGTTYAAANTAIKVGQQEFRVAASHRHMLQLSEPYLGASILPILTDVGVVSSALDTSPAGKDVLTINAPGTTIIANNLRTGARLYAGGCPFTGHDLLVDVIDTTIDIKEDHECQSDDFVGAKVYRRNDDSSNLALYRTSGDETTETQGLATKRGSPDVYIVSRLNDNAGLNAAATATAYQTASSTFTTTVGLATAVSVDTPIFVNGHGPIEVSAAAVADTSLVATGTEAEDFFTGGFSDANTKFPIYEAVSDTNSLTAGTILQLGGRRYKVKSRGSAGGVANAKVVLSDNFAGGQIVHVCSDCIEAGTVDGATITSAARVTLAQHEKIIVGGYMSEDLQLTVTADISDTTAISVSAGTNTGSPTAAFSTAVDLTAGNRLSMFRVLHQPGWTGAKVTESVDATHFQYVSQCSNRGVCDSSTGICNCFKGYSHDNCDTQNMLAM
jgi:hypothetical protein